MASHGPDPSQPKPSAPKDKNCPYCGQAFTSSSLGRHLDLYIKEKNPKPPDGVHDVDAIRKLRGSITRRHPRGSIGGRKDSTPVGTPRQSSAKRETSSAAESAEPFKPASIPKDGQYAVDSTLSKFPFVPRWETTGVVNDAAAKPSWESGAADAAPSDPVRRPPAQRTVSKQAAQKAQFDVKQKLADAMDTARAAELALRELLGSWRAAKSVDPSVACPSPFPAASAHQC